MAFSERSLRMLADSGSYQRGQAYFEDGKVRRLAVRGRTAEATVQGSELYRVQLVVDEVGLGGDCECPYSAEGFFCKHCVAVALAWLDVKPASGPAPKRSLEEFLLAQTPSWLVAELLLAAEVYPALRVRLDSAVGGQADTSAEAADAAEPADLRKRLRRAIEAKDGVDYRAANRYFLVVFDVLDEVAELAFSGSGTAARGLAEYALDLLEESMEQVDDSDGGGMEAFAQAESAHFEACMATPPDPVELADYLVDRALRSRYDIFAGAVLGYSGLLGNAGAAHYRERLEEAWRELPPKEPGKSNSRRFHVMALLERVAKVQGGTDGAVEVLARDVTDESDVVRIVQVLRQDGRDEDALGWAERGLTEFPPTDRLRSLAAACHLTAGRRQEAAKLLWDNFTEAPTSSTYQALADAAGEFFPGWRRKAHAFLRKQPRRTGRFALRGALVPGHSTLVDALLAEGEIDAAWRAAKLGGCHDKYWLRLATLRAHTHPGDAIPVFQEAAEFHIGNKERESYRTAAKLLRETKPLFKRAGRAADFESYLAALRLEHKTKPALQDELTRAGLP